MRRFNHSSNAASSYRPRMASLTAADTSWSIQMLLEEPANERAPDVSGAWPAVNADTMDLDALLEDDLTEDGAEYALSDEELELCEDGSQWIHEEESVIELSDDEIADVVEGTISLQDGDLEELEPESGGRMEHAGNGTVLFYCRPGDSLPPALVPTNELPRFAVPRGRLPNIPERLPQFSIADALAANEIPLRDARLPQFSIPSEPVRRPRVPPVRLPSFPIEEMRPRPPAPRRRPAPLPSVAQLWQRQQLAALPPQAWPLYQTAAASGSWPVHQSGEIPACPHCREQLLLAAAWSAAPALFGWGMAHR